MVLEQKLTKFSTASPIAAVIDFKDIESGLNFVDFFPMRSSDGGGLESIQILSDREEFSADVVNVINGATTTTNLTYDSTAFNIPKTLKGTAIFSCGIGATSGEIAVSVQVLKWDGSTATPISSEIQSVTLDTAGGKATMVLLAVPLTETFIAEGEQLRILVKQKGISSTVQYEIGQDPRGRAGTTVGTDAQTTTVTKISIPMKIE